MDEYAPVRYKMLKQIGEGVHGSVFKALDLQDQRPVAIKKVILTTKFGNISLHTLREIKTLQLCDSQFVSEEKFYLKKNMLFFTQNFKFLENIRKAFSSKKQKTTKW